MKNNKQPLVTTIIPAFNSATTITECLESLKSQTYKIAETIVVDGGSKDDTVLKIQNFIKKNPSFKIQLIRPTKNTSVAASYNLGGKMARTPLLIALHSDSILPTKFEVEKLLRPLIDDEDIVATYPIVINPKKVWDTYDFWLKCHFSRWAGSETPSMNGKFDCYRRSAFLKIGGHDTKKFQDRIGAEDVNLSQRLRKAGKVVLTDAKVLHLHYMGSGYTLKKWIEYRKVLSITYGKVIKNHWKDLKSETFIFLVKPFLAITCLIPFVNIIAIPATFLFCIYYMRVVYLDEKARRDPRIYILPFVTFFLVFYETYWMIRGAIFNRRQV